MFSSGKLLAFALLLTLTGCAGSSQPDPTEVSFSLGATKGLNPNSKGEPSPAVVQIYELAQTSVFEGAQFSELFYDGRKTLGGDLLGAVALTLKPGEEITRDYKFSSQTKFLGILVGYRDIANAKWREVVAVESEDSNDVVVTVDALSVSVAVDDSWF